MRSLTLVCLNFTVYILCLRNIFKKFILREKQVNLRLEDEYDKLSGSLGKMRQENDQLRQIVQKTAALYDITRQFCNTLDQDRIFQILLSHIKRYIELRDCRFIPKDADLVKYSDYTVMPLSIEDKIFGYLVASGVNVSDTDKFLILARQFIVGLKRAILYKEVEQLAIVDSLTQALNRRYFMERLNEEYQRSRKFHHSFSLLMLDVDRFKGINDRYGHLVGDAVLREISAKIKENIRQVDFLGRYGGEELALVLTETKKTQAGLAAERIRESVWNKEIKAYDERLRLSVSIGISTFPDDTQEVKGVIENADKALYRAKDEGRNRVCLY